MIHIFWWELFIMTSVLMKSTRNKFVQVNVTHYSGVWVGLNWMEGRCLIYARENGQYRATLKVFY